jgi:Uma2 family endonuclease
MAVEARHALYSLEDYLGLEEYANVKHEYLDGVIHAMAGGSPEHGAITMRIGAALVSQLRGRGCTVYSSDVRIRVAATALSTYPDVSVGCGERRLDLLDPQALADPLVLVEVLSPSTEVYDRGEKLRHYQQIPSLLEVLLVAHDRHEVEIQRRSEGGWTSETVGAGGEVELRSIGCRLDVEALYRD